MKRICIITSSFPSNNNDSSDAGIFVKDFSVLLSQEDFEVFVLAPHKINSVNDFNSIKVHFFPWLGGNLGLSSHNPKNPLHLIKLLSVVLSGLFSSIRFIRQNKIDYCLAMWAVPSGIFALMAKILLRKPFSTWSLGSDIWKIQDYPLGKFVLRKVLKNSEKLFADGLQLVQDVEKVSKKKCDFLPSSRILNTNEKILSYTNFDLTKKNFMFLGRYHTNKGVDLLIEAINLLSIEDKERSLFHIFGGGPLETKIKKMIIDFGLKSNTFINGHLKGNEVFTYMSKSDYIVIPSRIESIPVVLSDAIQSSKPVIVTNVGDMGELVSKFKVGFVTEPTAEKISKTISSIINSDNLQVNLFLTEMNKMRDYLDLKKSVQNFIRNINIDKNTK